MKTITIQGEQFEVNTPYSAGHQLTEIEAKVLNQTRCENIRNNMAKAVKDLLAEGKAEDARKAVAEYDGEYTFSTPGAGGGGRRLDPVEREAIAIARAYVTSKLKEQGRKVKDVDPEKLNAKIEEVAQNEKIVAAAKKRVAEKQKLADSLGDLDVSSEAPEGSAE